MGAIMAHEIGGRLTPEAYTRALSAALDAACAICLAERCWP